MLLSATDSSYAVWGWVTVGLNEDGDIATTAKDENFKCKEGKGGYCHAADNVSIFEEFVFKI